MKLKWNIFFSLVVNRLGKCCFCFFNRLSSWNPEHGLIFTMPSRAAAPLEVGKHDLSWRRRPYLSSGRGGMMPATWPAGTASGDETSQALQHLSSSLVSLSSCQLCLLWSVLLYSCYEFCFIVAPKGFHVPISQSCLKFKTKCDY